MTNFMASISKFNDKFALIVTNGVSTMWCAYAFCGIALTSLPSTLGLHSINSDVAWVAQTFIQLVLLSIIMVGQKVQSKSTDDLHDKVDALHEKHDALHRRLDEQSG
jgi:cytochrome c biogenesis factor